MSDTRPRITLNGKNINLAQLSQELGGAGLCASQTEIVAAEGAAVTQTQLQAAVDAHVAKPPTDPQADFVAAVQAAGTLAELKAAIIGQAGPGAQSHRPMP